MPPKKSGLADRFERATKTVQYRTICTVEGEVGTGKTFFGLTAGGPIVYHDIDLGAEGVIDNFLEEGKEIYHEKYTWIPGDPDEVEDEDEAKDLQTLAIEVRDKFLKNFHYAIKHGVRTQIADTESRFWQVFRYGEFGSPKGGDPKDYDEVNQRFESFVVKAKATPGMNLILLRSMKDQWGMYAKKKGGEKGFGKSGRREAWGYEHLPGQMFMELTMKRLEADNEKRIELEAEWGEGTCEYVITFGKCRHNAARQFTTIPRCSFSELGEMLIEGSSQEDWL